MSKTIEQNTIKIIKSGTSKDLLTCIGNMLAEPRRKTTLLGKSIRTDTVNPMYPNSQPNILHLKQATGTGHNVRNHLPIVSLNIGIDVTRSGWYIDKHTGMKPQGPIATMIPESNREKICNIFDLVGKNLDLAYSGLPWHGKMKSESEKLVEDLRGNRNFKSAEPKNIFEVEKFGQNIL